MPGPPTAPSDRRPGRRADLRGHTRRASSGPAAAMPPAGPARERSALRPISAAGSEGDGTPRSAAPISAGGLPGHLRDAARPDRVCAGLLPGRGAGAVASGEAVVSREHFVVPALDVVPVCFLGY